MNRERIAGYWRQFRGIARQRWGMLGEIQVACGVTKDVSAKQLAEWQAREHKADPIHK